jgi:glutamate synthase domain-containing protein 3
MDERVLRKLVQQHFHKTGSPRARLILAHWETYVARFRKVAPPPPAVVAVETVDQLQPTGSRA